MTHLVKHGQVNKLFRRNSLYAPCSSLICNRETQSNRQVCYTEPVFYSPVILSRNLCTIQRNVSLCPSLSSLRPIHTSVIRLDKSKIEDTLKEKQKKKQVTSTTQPTDGTVVPIKKPLYKRIWLEIVHYYHGFRLLFLDLNIASKSLWKLFCGKSLTRRENNQFKNAVSDLFRILPFSVFIIIPFAELALPIAVKLFPSLLPSTFESSSAKEARLKKQLRVKLEMAKFMQDAVENIAIRSKKSSQKNEAANNFVAFLEKIRNSTEQPTNKEILEHAKLFENEVTLDSMEREQLIALCRLLQVTAVGSNNVLRFLLQLKLSNLQRDDETIQAEGIENLNPSELQAACQARGMRALGMTTERLKTQLSQWIDLHLNQNVPTSLLLYSRVLYLPENVPAEEQIKAAISALPEKAANEAGVRAAELNCERVDNTERYKISKQENEAILKESKEERAKEKQRKIELELKKKKEEEKLLAAEKSEAESIEDISKVTQPVSRLDTIAVKDESFQNDTVLHMVDKAPQIDANAESEFITEGPVLTDSAKTLPNEEITKEEIQALDKAIDKIVGEETIAKAKTDLEDLKEDFEEYQQDIKKLSEEIIKEKDEIVSKEVKTNVRLQKSIKRLIDDMERIVTKIEEESSDKLGSQYVELSNYTISNNDVEEEETKTQISTGELVTALNNLQGVSEEKLSYIANILDGDKNGEIEVDEALAAIQAIDKEDVNITPSQLHQLILLVKQERDEIKKKKEQEPNKKE